MSNEANADSNQKADTVVSVRFATGEVTELKRLADAQKIPLSTLIRQIALGALVWTPPIAQLASSNASPPASGWASYQLADVRSGSQSGVTSLTVTYTSPGIS